MVFHAIKPASVPTSNSGPLPNMGTCVASLTSASALDRISPIASLSTGVESSGPSSPELIVKVHAVELPKIIKSISPLPVSSSTISSIGPMSELDRVSILGIPSSSETECTPRLVPIRM